jgi:hypothetical protein
MKVSAIDHELAEIVRNAFADRSAIRIEILAATLAIDTV